VSVRTVLHDVTAEVESIGCGTSRKDTPMPPTITDGPSLVADATEYLTVNPPTTPNDPASKTTDQVPDGSAAPLGPDFVVKFWDAEFKPVVPTIMPIVGGDPLFYPGRINAISGEPGRGKTLISLYVAVTLAKEKVATLFIDLEKDLPAFLDKIRALGATKEDAAHIGYWRLTTGITKEVMTLTDRFVCDHDVSMVTIDSVGRALSRDGLTENDNDDVRRWVDRVPEAITRINGGTTVLLIDHVKKPSGGFGHGGADRYFKGAGAKLDAITGCAYNLQVDQPFSRSQPGGARLVTIKDNAGFRYEGEVAAEILVVPSDEGRSICLTIRKSVAFVGASGMVQPTPKMKLVSEFLSARGGTATKAAVKAGVTGRGETVLAAIEELIALEFVTFTPQGKTTQLNLVKRFDDDAIDELRTEAIQRSVASDPPAANVISEAPHIG
jgi:hypothetical protein